MIKIKIIEIDKHRNECTFRPYLNLKEFFNDVGIEFVVNNHCQTYDYCWIAQSSYTDKSASLPESIEKGLEYLDKIEGDYWLFDGQDSASLIGTYDVFLKSKAQHLLKNTIYSNKDDYTLPFLNGRSYWGMSYKGWKITDFSRYDDVKLSGTNWLSTVTPNWFVYDRANKDIDVFAMFSYPSRENYEYGLKTSENYDAHRSRCIEELKKLPRNIKVQMLENGQKVSLEEYYNLMSRSKIVVAPFGYGEMAPRDIESAMVGAILVKPNMSHLASSCNPYVENQTYIDVLWNFEDMNTKILTALDEDFWPHMQERFVEGMRSTYIREYNPEKLVMHIYNLIKNSSGVENE